MLEKLFHLQESGTTVKREIVAGCTTFMTLSYIIFVQPAVLSAAGMDSGAVMAATCITSAFAMVLMAFLANYPIALAPGMGHNFYFAFTVCLTLGVSWQNALGAVFVAGVLFILLFFVGLREKVMTILPVSLRNAIPAGIGLLIALVGLEWAGLIVDHPATYVTLGDLKSPPALLSLFGVIVIAILFALKVRGAILIGILASTVVGLITMVKFQGVVSATVYRSRMACINLVEVEFGCFRPALHRSHLPQTRNPEYLRKTGDDCDNLYLHLPRFV